MSAYQGCSCATRCHLSHLSSHARTAHRASPLHGTCALSSPCSRQYFDQDRGAEFLRRVSITRIDSEVLARYTVLGAAFALLKYIESTTAMTFPRASVKLHFIDSNAADFLTIDRRTAMGLEILSNARSGDQKNCLFGKIDHTKVRSNDLATSLLNPSAARACATLPKNKAHAASPHLHCCMALLL